MFVLIGADLRSHVLLTSFSHDKVRDALFVTHRSVFCASPLNQYAPTESKKVINTKEDASDGTQRQLIRKDEALLQLHPSKPSSPLQPESSQVHCSLIGQSFCSRCSFNSPLSLHTHTPASLVYSHSSQCTRI